MKNKKTIGLALVIAVSGVMITQGVLASPPVGSTAPDGAVNAHFNSVQADAASTFTSGVTAGGTSSFADITANSISGYSLNGTAISGSSPQGVGVSASSTSGKGVQAITGSGFGVEGTSTSSIGVYGHSTSSDGVNGTSSTGVGVRGTSSGTVAGSAAGSFTNTNGTGVLLGTSNRAISTSGIGDIEDNGNFLLQGAAYNNSSNPFTIGDTDGLKVQNTLTSPTKYFSINPTTQTLQLTSTSGAATIYMNNSLDLSSQTLMAGAANISGPVTVSGKITSSGGIGTIYKVNAPTTGTIAPGAVFGFAGTATCTSGDRVLSCGIDFSGSGNVVLSQVAMTGTSSIRSCTVYAYNPTNASNLSGSLTAGSSQSAKAYAMCFSPSSSAVW